MAVRQRVIKRRGWNLIPNRCPRTRQLFRSEACLNKSNVRHGHWKIICETWNAPQLISRVRCPFMNLQRYRTSDRNCAEGAYCITGLLWGARYGAMALRNFREALGTVRGLIGQCPTFLPDVDTKALRAVEKDFDDTFPRIEKLRHSVAHPEFYSDPDKKMTADGGVTVAGVGFGVEYGDMTRVAGDLVFGTYVATINGIAVKYAVSADTVRLVSAFAARAFEAFKGVPEPKHSRCL
jgi:hypothetical protein